MPVTHSGSRLRAPAPSLKTEQPAERMAPTLTASLGTPYLIPRLRASLSLPVDSGGSKCPCSSLPIIPVRPFCRTGPCSLPLRLSQCQAVLDVGNGGKDGFGGSGSSGGGGGGDSGGNYDGGKEHGKRDSLASWYLKAMEEHPVFTKSLTTSFLNLAGDLICQLLINRVSVLDFKRLSVTAFLGFVLVGPTLHFWYYSLSVMVPLPGTSGTLLRLFLDQFFFSPVFIGVFLSSLVTLEGRPSQVVPRLKQEWFRAVLANWQLWIPFQFLNFQFVPQQFQVLAANVIAVAWNVILSFHGAQGNPCKIGAWGFVLLWESECILSHEMPALDLKIELCKSRYRNTVLQ